ncbi:ImmA/IrrE family metallo-endopeptidase [Mycobacteroides abscessus]|uniref:ImmA/IrrE family metallo-endopeptidase n=1 Tax=Mycobacteroides abscessus TaxID=36809 RepID=UPI001F351AEF
MREQLADRDENVVVYGQRVRQARVLRQLAGTVVLKQMGWRGAKLTRLEKGPSTLLSIGEVCVLAEALRFPVEFLMTPPTQRRLPELTFRPTKRAPTAGTEFAAQFSAAVGEFVSGLGQYMPLPTISLPTIGGQISVAMLAAAVRRCMGVSVNVPIGDVIGAAEQAGAVVVMYGDGLGVVLDKVLPQNHLGWSAWVGDRSQRPVIVLREDSSWERIRWAMAHEVGHLVLGWSPVGSSQTEDLADHFAGELLAPASALAAELPAEPVISDLAAVKRKWGIAIGTLIPHLWRSGLITDSRYETLKRQLYTKLNRETGHTWGKTEPGWDDRCPEQPELLAKLLQRRGDDGGDQIWPNDVRAAFVAGQRFAAAPIRYSATDAVSSWSWETVSA